MLRSEETTLFGWDLSLLAKRMRLGVDQLLFGSEAGLYARFKPTAVSITEAELLRLEEESADRLEGAAGTSAMFYEVEIPKDLSLCREITVPAEAEAFLHDVVAAEVGALSPFAHGNTCWGSCITRRHANSISVKIALSELSLVQEHARHVADALSANTDDIELFVSDGPDRIRVIQFSGAARQRAYLESLRNLALKGAIWVVAAASILSLPGIVAGHSLEKLEDLAQATQARTQEVMRIRTQFESNLTALEEASVFFAEQDDYGWWLNKIAEIAPDTVYLNRLGLLGSELTLTGLALNAAEFQTILVESELFDSLTATSAFTRDRSGRERFTFVMTLNQREQP